MGWNFKWVSSHDSDFNSDYYVLFTIHYHYLDIVPKGRNENGRGPFWVRRRDEYEPESHGR